MPATADPSPEVCSLTDAAHRLGISPSHAYELVRKGEFPVPVLKMGRVVKVATRVLDEALGIRHEPVPAPAAVPPTVVVAPPDTTAPGQAHAAPSPAPGVGLAVPPATTAA